MKFYDILQLDPQANRAERSRSTNQREKVILGIGLGVRAILIVLFAIAFIATLSAAFGSDNTPMAVVIFCILLGARFVDFGYCTKDELLTLSAVFFILLFSPVVGGCITPLLDFFVNALSLFAILFITCDKPEMGNGGLFGFGYIYLVGNPVYGEALLRRSYLTFVGLAICGFVFYLKHKDKNENIRFHDKIKQANLMEFKYQWMLKLSLGISALLAICIALHLERFMWAGFACNSVLSLYSPRPNIKQRCAERMIGASLGLGAFSLLYHLLPVGAHGIIAPLGGFFLGFCADYKYKTALNCLGAVMIAAQIYGLPHSLLLRMTHTALGLVFATAFLYLYERYIFPIACKS